MSGPALSSQCHKLNAYGDLAGKLRDTADTCKVASSPDTGPLRLGRSGQRKEGVTSLCYLLPSSWDPRDPTSSCFPR